MRGKYSELAFQFREKANENNFLMAMYSNVNGRDLWGCICSAMDWIDVGAQYIEKFHPSGKHGLQNCIEIYSFISAIDITYEAIISLFWVLQKNGDNQMRGRTPFYQEKGCFSVVTNSSITDDRFFKEIRSCCGAHPTDLNTLISEKKKKKNQRRYASWTYTENNTSFQITLYPENTIGNTITVKIFYSELIAYFEQRFNYLNILMKRIDELHDEFREEKRKEPIPKSSNPIEQLNFLKTANKQRLKREYYDGMIDQLISFFTTDFKSKENEDIVNNYRDKVLLGMETLYYNIQYFDYKDMTLDDLIYPLPIKTGWFGYEFAALSGQMFSDIDKLFDLKVLTDSLKEIVCFDNVHTKEELYWLIVIALNIINEKKN